MIGIIGGVGPYAGLYLHNCILDQTNADCDQDYLPVLHINNGSEVPDRTEFLLGRNGENPAGTLTAQIGTLYHAGARIIGIPCNTAHAGVIYNVISGHFQKQQDLVLINMIDELFKEMVKRGETKTGLLATLGSYQSGLFQAYAEKYEIEVVLPDDSIQEMVHDTIYNPADGIKSTGRINTRIKTQYDSIIKTYQNHNIHSMILGCTEISMVFPPFDDDDFRTFKTIDILAKALIREFQNVKLQQAL